jgi:hypothetical protein
MKIEDTWVVSETVDVTVAVHDDQQRARILFHDAVRSECATFPAPTRKRFRVHLYMLFVSRHWPTLGRSASLRMPARMQSILD